MQKRTILSIFGIVFIVVAAGLLFYQPVIRPWHMRFGATESEVGRALPGDEIVSGVALQSTRAITIQAAPDQAWPWLLQLGQGRGGLYSYDWLENLAGCDIHTLDRIDPMLQNLQVGDTIRIGAQDGLPRYRVVLIEPGSALVLRSFGSSDGEMGETWGFYLSGQEDGSTTRLVIRHRSPPAKDSTGRVVNAIFEPISFVMEERMLRGIRAHVEGQ